MENYCTQNNGHCETCSLVNYGMDCHNNPKYMLDLGTGEPMDTEFLASIGMTHGELKNVHHNAFTGPCED